MRLCFLGVQDTRYKFITGDKGISTIGPSQKKFTTQWKVKEKKGYLNKMIDKLTKQSNKPTPVAKRTRGRNKG